MLGVSQSDVQKTATNIILVQGSGRLRLDGRIIDFVFIYARARQSLSGPPCNTSGPLTDGFLVMPHLGATDERQQIVVTGVGVNETHAVVAGVGVGSVGRYRGGAGGEAVVVAAAGVGTGCGQRTRWRASCSSSFFG